MQSSVVPKPWGWEYCAFDNGKAAVWILHIARGRQTSNHCHPNKKTRLIPLTGEVRFNGSPVKPLQVLEVDKGAFHQTSCVCEIIPASENGAFVMEIEEPSDKADIVRAEDLYGRKGKPIEAERLSYSGPLLKLSTKAQKAMGYTFKIEQTLGGDQADLMLSVGGEVLGIYKEPEKKVSDCVFEFVKFLGVKKVFGVTGGGSMHLNDSFREIFLANHHEQASAMAADAYGRLTNLGCCLVTTGPGGTNALTGLLCSYVDSVPVLYISGQVTSDTLKPQTVRQYGIQETDIVSMVKPVTKYAVTVKKASLIRYELEKAAWHATHGRKGPVWVDIPLDIQGRFVRWEDLGGFNPPYDDFSPLPVDVNETYRELGKAERPVLLIGNGVHLSGGESEAVELANHLGIPVITSWTAKDIFAEEDLHIGCCGIFGDRASNFTVQNSDLILCIGSRLSIAQTGYNLKHFAREARIIMVDVDRNEAYAKPFKVHEVVADAKLFMKAMLERPWKWIHGDWRARCNGWKEKYPVLKEHEEKGEFENSFHFIDRLSKSLQPDAVVVTDMGTSFTCTFQASKMKRGQRWLTASGHAPMGYGLPGAIGAYYATGKPITCIVGDGALMFNLQELKTILENSIPVRIIVIDNDGYLTMKHTQMNHFGRLVGSKFENVHWGDLARCFGLIIEVVKMDPMQPLIPRSSSYKRPDGSITSKPLEDMYPFLPRDEFKAQMIVPTVESL